MNNKFVVDVSNLPTVESIREINKMLKKRVVFPENFSKTIESSLLTMTKSLGNLSDIYNFSSLHNISDVYKKNIQILASNMGNIQSLQTMHKKQMDIAIQSMKDYTDSLHRQNTYAELIRSSLSSLSQIKIVEVNNYRDIISELLTPLENDNADEIAILAAETTLQEISDEDSLKPIFNQAGISEENQVIIFEKLDQINGRLETLDEKLGQQPTQEINANTNQNITQQTTHLLTPFYLDTDWYFEELMSSIFQSVFFIFVKLDNPVFIVIFTTFVLNKIRKHLKNR